MASYLKKSIDHPGKAIDILGKVIKEISEQINLKRTTELKRMERNYGL